MPETNKDSQNQEQDQNVNAAPPVVAIIGAGPAGLYAARKFSRDGYKVVLINRDLKPGGLAEYGIYHDKHKLKNGLRKQFTKILADENIFYVGGVEIGDHKSFNLEKLASFPFGALLFTIGAQGTRMLGLNGEDNAKGVFHAKDLVYHFNQLPPFASQEFDIGKRVGIIGMGNVMADIAQWLIVDKHVEEVTVLARRGPAERAYTDKEVARFFERLDLEDLDGELQTISDKLEAVDQNVEELRTALMKPLKKAEETNSESKFRFRFLVSTQEILKDEETQRVTGVRIERNALVYKNDVLRPTGTGETEVIPMDTLIYAIGDQVDSSVGLPYKWGKYIVSPDAHPRVAERPRYEVYDPETQSIRAGWFVGGWARAASDGLVGKARADGETAVEEVMEYLQGSDQAPGDFATITEQLLNYLEQENIAYVTKEDVQKLESIEREKAKENNTVIFKFNTNEEMFEAIGKV